MKISYKVLFAAVLATAGTNAFAADVSGLATTNYVKGAIDSLSDVARTGSYDDLDNKPTLGALATKETITNADVASNAAIAVSKISGAQATANIVNPNGDGEFAAGDTGSTTKYPSMKAAEQIAAAAASDAVTSVASNITALQDEISDLSTTVESNKASLGALASKDAVSSADITDGTIVNADIADNAAISTSKISGLDTALSGKQATANIVNPNADGEFAAGDTGSTTKYPSMKAAEQIAATAASDAVTSVASNITALQDEISDLSATVEGNKASLGALATKDTVATADIDDAAVTGAKLASNSVTNAKIADDAVTTGKIKGYDTGECSGTNCALVDLGAGAVWLPIVNEYAGN